jgi:SsrA-binding protein
MICTNRKARFEYEILDTIEAGIVLYGDEVKSIRQNKVSLEGSFAVVLENEVWMINCHIGEYDNRNNWRVLEPTRRRKLLLNRKEITKFAERSEEKGFTLIPLSMYFKNGVIKIELAVGKGKQLHDKRETERRKETEKEIKQFI